MNILYVGDIMGEAGINVIRKVLPKIKTDHPVDLVVAQAENVSQGKGISKADYIELRKLGVDCFTGGNWSLHLSEIHDFLGDPQQPIVRPANYPSETPGKGWKYVDSKAGKVLIISLLGSIVGKDSEKPMDNPLIVVDQILDQTKDTDKVATIVNFHGDYSSEKRIIGYYLDGRVSAVIGDHWHVPTADARVLANGTAHMSDVGMCGSLESSLGVKFDSVIPRWKDGRVTKNELETKGKMQFNGALIKTNQQGLSNSIEHIQIVY